MQVTTFLVLSNGTFCQRLHPQNERKKNNFYICYTYFLRRKNESKQKRWFLHTTPSSATFLRLKKRKKEKQSYNEEKN
jgi:hypothetical protein